MNLTLYINRSEPDPRLALVISQSDMTRRPMPVLTLGDLLNLTIIGVDGAGAVSADSGDAAYSPRMVLGLKGHESLVATSTFTAVAGPPKGWSCALNLDDDELTMFVRSSLRAELALSFLTVHATTGRATWLACPVTVEDGVGLDEVDTVEVVASDDADATKPKIMGTVTTHAEIRALATPGYGKPKLFTFLIADQWENWTLRTKAGSGEDDDDVSFIEPTDADLVTNNVVFVKSAVA